MLLYLFYEFVSFDLKKDKEQSLLAFLVIFGLLINPILSCIISCIIANHYPILSSVLEFLSAILFIDAMIFLIIG